MWHEFIVRISLVAKLSGIPASGISFHFFFVRVGIPSVPEKQEAWSGWRKYSPEDDHNPILSYPNPTQEGAIVCLKDHAGHELR